MSFPAPLDFNALPAPAEVTRPCGCRVRTGWTRLPDSELGVGARFGPPEHLFWCDEHRVDAAPQVVEQLRLFGGQC